MNKKVLAFLSPVVIVTACSPEVVNTWDPEKEITQRKAGEEKCREWRKKPSHKHHLGYHMYLDGNKYYRLTIGDCPKFRVIGKTYILDGRDNPRLAGAKLKYAKQGKDVIEYLQLYGWSLEKHVHKSIR